MGTITILPETPKDPISLIGRRAGICYGANVTDAEKNYKRGLDCLESEHGRTFEFPDVHMVIEGYSARVMREYERHVGGLTPWLQASTRYIDYAKKGFEYITPHSIAKNEKAKFLWDDLMTAVNRVLLTLETEYNIPKEDTANGLPLGMTTRVVEKRNVRNLIDMSRNRECVRAYWEFRELFSDIKNALSEYSPEWKTLVELKFMPKCEYSGFCTESRGCGRYPKKC